MQPELGKDQWGSNGYGRETHVYPNTCKFISQLLLVLLFVSLFTSLIVCLIVYFIVCLNIVRFIVRFIVFDFYCLYFETYALSH